MLFYESFGKDFDLLLLQESDLHTKRTGHTEFSDKTSETTKPIALEVAKNPSSSDVDMVDASSSGEPEGICYLIFSLLVLVCCLIRYIGIRTS